MFPQVAYFFQDPPIAEACIRNPFYSAAEYWIDFTKCTLFINLVIDILDHFQFLAITNKAATIILVLVFVETPT